MHCTFVKSGQSQCLEILTGLYMFSVSAQSLRDQGFLLHCSVTLHHLTNRIRNDMSFFFAKSCQFHPWCKMVFAMCRPLLCLLTMFWILSQTAIKTISEALQD